MGVFALVGSSTTLAANVYHTLNLGESETYSHVTDDGPFTDMGIFTLDEAALVNVSISDTEVTSSGAILDVSTFTVTSNTGFSASIDNLTSYIFSLGSLDAGDYTLTFQGESAGVWGGIYDVTVSAVPLPAAAWLMGSALFGFAVFSSRKSV
jgi:hypothetical protein